MMIKAMIAHDPEVDLVVRLMGHMYVVSRNKKIGSYKTGEENISHGEWINDLKEYPTKEQAFAYAEGRADYTDQQIIDATDD